MNRCASFFFFSRLCVNVVCKLSRAFLPLALEKAMGEVMFAFRLHVREQIEHAPTRRPPPLNPLLSPLWRLHVCGESVGL